MSNDAKKTVQQLLSLADIKVGGRRPFDIQVHDDRFYGRLLGRGTLGLGEAYMDGWWDARQPDEFISRVLAANLREKVQLNPALAWTFAKSLVMNRQTVGRAHRNASHHYNIGNDLYERMLDKRMIYSCAYWSEAQTLDEAQLAKLDLVCRKLHLKKGMTLLDIGCGWGGFSEYAARKYGVKVTGITPAAEQVKIAKKRTKGLPVTILQKDYRRMRGSFDRIVSIGMLEHVGYKNYDIFFKKCQELLNDGGLMVHHVIGGNHSTKTTEPWIDKYIFPGAILPALAQLAQSVERRFIIEDVHNFGPYYDKTLLAWEANFTKHYPEISRQYDERFYRMWRYYLLSCAGAFRARHIQLWQLVMRKIEPSKTYQASR
jgi:cyclopropane-fatty-acyl-phospholipid synthase